MLLLRRVYVSEAYHRQRLNSNEKVVSLGTLSAYLFQLRKSLSNLSSSLEPLNKNLVNAERAEHIRHVQSEIVDQSSAVPLIRCKGSVVF